MTEFSAGDVVFNPASFPPEPPEGTVVQAFRMVTRAACREGDPPGVREVEEPKAALYIRYTPPNSRFPLWFTLHGLIAGESGSSYMAMPWWMLCRESEKARRSVVVADTLSEAEAHCPHCTNPVGPLEMRIMLDELREAVYGSVLDRLGDADGRRSGATTRRENR